MLTREEALTKFAEVLAANPTLGRGGYCSGLRDHLEAGFDLVYRAHQWVMETFEPASRFSRRCTGSYGLKHDFERSEGVYMPNGFMIAAFILSGFKVAPDEGGLNAKIAYKAALARKASRIAARKAE